MVRATGAGTAGGYLNLGLYSGDGEWPIYNEYYAYNTPPDAGLAFDDCDAAGLAAGDYLVNVDGVLEGAERAYELALYVLDCEGGVGDTDSDGFPDSTDNCPIDANVDQADLDADGRGDVCDDDVDGDGWNTDWDALPENPTEWRDQDEDGIGDNADPDDNGDGLPDDAYEPDNWRDLATPLSPGEVQLHTLIGDGDQDWVGFTLTADTHLVVRALGAGSDYSSSRLELGLYGDDDDWPAYSDYTWGLSLDAQVGVADCSAPGLPAGDYAVRVSGALYGLAPSYGIALYPVACDGSTDLDGDGEPDSTDNCLFAPNTNQADLDADGLGDVCDDDRDGDGWYNNDDLWPEDPTEWRDQDSDGLGDNADADDNDDGQADDDYEPDNWRDVATPLVAGHPQGHTLIGYNDQDWFSFTLTEATDLVIRAQGTGVDSGSIYLGLYAGESARSEHNVYRYGTPPDARLDFSDCSTPGLPAGDYAVKVNGNLYGTAPGYDIELTVVACDRDGDGYPDAEDNCPLAPNPDQADRDDNGIGDACDEDIYEPDDTREQATLLLPAATQSHNLLSDGEADQDWVSFSLADETHLVVRGLGVDVDSGWLGLALYRGTDEWYSYWDDSSDVPPDARIDYADCFAPGLAAGDYAVNVSGDLYGTAPGYDIGLYVVACDGSTDLDGDSEPDSSDNCLFEHNADQADLDADGLGDVCDDDRDGDGYYNDYDPFPDDPTEWRDQDGDGIGDNADTDDNDDGVADDAYEPDNWRHLATPLIPGEV